MANQNITLSFPDGSERNFDAGTTGFQVAEDISAGLARNALAVKIDGEVRDLSRPITTNAAVQILTWNDDEGRQTYWHSSAHLLAEALEELYPGVKFGIGPAIEGGYYYDIDLGEHALGDHEFDAIEKKMKALAKKNEKYVRTDVSKADAIAYFAEKNDEYKLELLEGLDDGTITFYQQGDFVDLCRGPHIPSTKTIKCTKLLSVAGAYWRGQTDRKQLTRIYAISFPKQKMLDEHLEMLEEAKKRDHRKLGKELGLFTFSPKVGAGLPLWLPKGAQLRQTLMDFLQKEQIKRGYQSVVTPHIGRLELYKTSGHYPYYKESQFPPMFDEDGEGGYLLKPMNCPHHAMIYADKPHSYRDLPLRLSEFGTVYRNEQSGELNGLTRVRGFTQDDGHIFCMPDQVKGEFKNVIGLILKVLKALEFTDFKAQVSLRDPNNPDKYVGDPKFWDIAEQGIREAADEMGLETVEVEGEAAFYGPKLDFMVRDALRREWQLGTVQVDYNLPERFDLTYVGEDNAKHRPVMIHRAPFGSMERFTGVMIEHCAGNFPVWLAPTQIAVLSIGKSFNAYAEEVAEKLRRIGLRIDLDVRSEKIGYKIRTAETQKVPYMLILGAKEQDGGTVSIRKHGEGMKDSVSLEAFIEQVDAEINAVLNPEAN